ncbi:MAG: response regulator [Verrucomicrobiae bacterium]|nr:response regulator [Verrucomicrobiae bacterium]
MGMHTPMPPSRIETATIPELSELLGGNGKIGPPGEVESAAVPPPTHKKHPDTRNLDVSGSAVGTVQHVVRILIVDDDRTESASLHWALSQRLAMELVGVARDGAECLNLARRHTPDVVLLKDIVQVVDCMRVAETLADELPEVGVILMTTGWIRVDTRWRDLLHAGISGFVTYPPPLDALLEQIDHVSEHQRKLRKHLSSKSVKAAEPPPLIDHRRVVAFTGPRGGCGRSLLASNLAVCLAARNRSVCLVDLNSDGGDIAPLLDIHPHYTVGDLALAAEDIERDMIANVLVRHSTGVNVIPAPRAGTLQGDSLTPYFIQRLLGFAREQHDFTIVDTAPGLNGSVGPILGVAEAIVAMIGFDLIRLQQGAAFIAELAENGIDLQRIITVLVSESDHPLIQLADAQRILSTDITCVVPFDPMTALESVNKGVPFVLSSPHKPLSKAVRALARKLTGESRPPQTIPWWKRVLGVAGNGEADED